MRSKTSSVTILNLLKQFLERKVVILNEENRKNPQILHYYTEIVRNFNKINFIFKKTLRALNQSDNLNSFEKAKYFYSTYRIIWENATRQSLILELNLSSRDESRFIFYRYQKQLKGFSWEKALEGKSKEEKLSLIEAIPSFLIECLIPVMTFEMLKTNLHYLNNLNKFSSFTVRINNLTRSSKKILRDLKRIGIKFEPDRNIPEIIHIPINNKNKLLESDLYRSGNMIFQDKASAAVAHVLSPNPHELICDMCAAPGIKTSLIAQYAKNKSTIIASDFHYKRLKQAKKLLANLSVSNCYELNTDSIKLPIRFENYFDKVLLDAPCTGSGSILANPELKWRQNNDFLYQNITLQRKLLRSAINYLKPNGILVYSTCSLYQEEGELQIADFLDELEPMKLPDWFSESYRIDGILIPGTGRLFPSIHQTQGFFIGKFKKKAL